MLTFDNSYINLPSRFYASLNPKSVTQPKLIRINHSLAALLGVDSEELSSETGISALAGNHVLPGAEPLAMAYAGHQFGGWVPSLGDGRALLLGEVIGKDGIRYDIQLKGSGKTPFSRSADGRAWLGPVIREYLVSEAMYALGIPTTRSMAVVETGDLVYRERALPGAVLTRVARCLIRVGTFQYFYARKDTQAVKMLADYLINRIYPDLQSDENCYLGLLNKIITGQAELTARWMAVGFIHGVMNTDNMSLACETIDYGPCAFMDRFKFRKVFSSIDHTARYSYANQPVVAHWNLVQFASCIVPLLDHDSDIAVSMAQEAIDLYPAIYRQCWLDQFRLKLGLHEKDANDETLISSCTDALENADADFTNFFRTISEFPPDALNAKDFSAFCHDPEILIDWVDKWRQRIKTENVDELTRMGQMQTCNPVYIPRNHQIEQAIAEAENGDYRRFSRLAEVLSQPYKVQPEYHEFAFEPQTHEVVTRTFCGT